MEVTVRIPAKYLSDEERSLIVRALALALAPYRPRVARAALRLRDGEPSGAGRARVEIAVPLGPSGVVRVEGTGSCATSAARAAIRRAAAAVEKRLAAERQELLEFLLVASVASVDPAPVADGGRAGPARASPRRATRRSGDEAPPTRAA